jgi:hypothetical protein
MVAKQSPAWQRPGAWRGQKRSSAGTDSRRTGAIPPSPKETSSVHRSYAESDRAHRTAAASRLGGTSNRAATRLRERAQLSWRILAALYLTLPS